MTDFVSFVNTLALIWLSRVRAKLFLDDLYFFFQSILVQDSSFKNDNALS